MSQREYIGRNLSPRRKNRIRVFLLDDHELIHSAIEAVVNGSPEGDMVCVGGNTSLSESAPEEVQQAQADVVIVDILDTGAQDRPSGLRTIRALRRKLGASIGIIGYSAVSDFDRAAESCGADTFVGKGAINDHLRHKIRTCKDHNVISRIELSPETREFTITISRNCAIRQQRTMSLQRDAFALLLYLAEERATNGTDWIIKEDCDDSGSSYRFKEEELWRSIRRKWSGKNGASETLNKTSSDFNISKHSAEINRTVDQAVGSEYQTMPLITVPGVGRKSRTEHIYAGTYFLNPFIEARDVVREAPHSGQ